MTDSNMQLLYATAEATGISRASGSLEGIMSCVEIVILIVYCVVFCSDLLSCRVLQYLSMGATIFS
jgi:hypothetical protein